MKNNIFSGKTLAVIISIISLSGHRIFAQTGYVRDSAICYEWDSLANWQKTTKTITTYNANGKELSSITYYWDESLLRWENSSKRISTYSSGRVSSILQTWDGIGW